MRARVTLLTSPVFTGLVLVLVLNDQVLKRSFPGLVTGKLSDFAGMALVAMVLGVLTGRVAPAVVFTGVGFVALKTVPGVAEIVSPLLGGVTRRDTTDLAALVALVPTARWLAHRVEGVHAHGLAGQCAVVAVGLVTVLAIAGDSCSGPDRVDVSTTTSGRLVAAIVSEPHFVSWVGSRDGLVWHDIRKPKEPVARAQSQACVRSGSCFRVRIGSSVEQRSPSGDWRTSFAFTPDQSANAAERGVCRHAARFTSLTTFGRPGREQVVVAMGDDGVLVRSAHGRWQRRAIGLDLRPVRLDGAPWLREVPPLAFLGLWVVLIVWFLVGWVARRKLRDRPAFLVAAGGMVASMPLVGFAVWGLDFTVAGPAILTMASAVFLVSLLVAIIRPLRRAPA